MRLAIAFLAVTFISGAPLFSQTIAVPTAGDTKISVATPGAGAVAIFSAPTLAGCNAAAGTPVALVPAGGAVTAAGTHSLTLSSPLMPGIAVCGTFTAPPPPPVALTVLPPVQVQLPPMAPTPMDGDTKVTIATTPAATGDSIALFTVVAPAPGAATPTCNSSATALPLAANSGNLVGNGTQTAVTLKDPLAQGMIICAVITHAAAPAATYITAAVTVGAPSAPPGFDWGMVRAYFTFGALLSQADSQFSHEDLFLAFRLDKYYAMFHKKSDPDNYGHRPGLNTFFETRLTALPVAVQNCSPTMTTTCSNSNSSSTPATPASTTTSQAFLNSQKSARLLFGVYAPIFLHEWHVASRTGSQTQSIPYTLFVAPLVKTGFDTTLNGLNQTQQSSSTPATVQPIGNSSEFYKFYDYGFRLGHYHLSTNPEVSPDLLSYLDVTWGRFSNLASLICDTTKYAYDPGANTCSLPSGSTATAIGELPWQRDTRLNVEGLLEIPATKGFSVGFSANVVFDPLSDQGTKTLKHIRPNDDLRFLFAYKFDITSIAAKLAPQPTN